MSDPVPELLELLGPVVLIGWPKGSKGTDQKWGHLTLEDMTPQHLGKLKDGNIGVALGEVSGGLCAIDCDRDDFAEAFLAVNPALAGTLQTHGARGRVFWVRFHGVYPKQTIKFKNDSGEAIGEFRSNGAQSIVWGIHPDTQKPYEFVVKKPALRIEFGSIRWPADISNPPGVLCRHADIQTNSVSLHLCVSASLHDCIPASLHNRTMVVLGNIAARKQALKALAADHPALARLYTELVEPRFQALPHARNDFITQAVPFLYRAVAAPFVPLLVGCFYDCNRATFNDSREQHMKEAQAMLASVTKSYTDSLIDSERQVYEALNEQEQAAFRICRDLAQLPEPQREPLTFFLSFEHLGARLGVFPIQAQRIMRQLEIYGLLKLLEKGTKRALGVPGKAGTYRWLL
jgi:hypothetical protein